MKWIKWLLYLFVFALVCVSVAYGIVAANQETEVLDADARQQAPGKFITLSDGITHYRESGSAEGTPIIFIHGGGITGMEVWKQNVTYFSERGFRILEYDLYGRGYSDRPDTDYTPELMQRQLVELMDSLQIRDSLHLVSMSMGSMVALDFAVSHPDKIQKLVMLDPALTGEFRANALLKIPVLSDILMTFYWHPRAVENQRKEFVNDKIFEPYADRLRFFMQWKGYKAVNYSTWMHTLNQNKLALLTHVLPGRVLLVYGEQDPYFPKGLVPRFQEVYPSLEVKEIAGTGHMPHLEKPAEVNGIIRQFLLKREQADGDTSVLSTTEKPE